jgi:hypothetical protein
MLEMLLLAALELQLTRQQQFLGKSVNIPKHLIRVNITLDNKI